MGKTYFILSVCILFALSSCSSDDNEGGTQKNLTIKGYKNKNLSLQIIEDGTPDFNSSDYKSSEVGKEEREFIDNMNEFSMDLFRSLAVSDLKNGNNTFISGYSVEQVLGMIANGAAGTSLSEILSAFGSGSVESLNAFNKILSNQLDENKGKSRLDIANAIWMQNSDNILRSFVSNVTNYYDADIYAHDFTSSDAGRIINRWCSDKTDGMIDQLFDDGSLPYSLLFTNALYFKSDWQYKFDKKLTAKDKFTNFDLSTSEVDMMRWKNPLYLNYANLEKMNVVSLPYKDNCRMAVALPDDEVDLSDCISAFNKENWEKILEGFDTNIKKYKFDVVFPKFDLSSDFYLVSSLMSQGIVSVFGDNADLSKLSQEKKSIGAVRQVTRLKIYEDGAEASAVTVAGDVSTNPNWGEKVEFRLDRPFLIAIYDTTTNAILFLGCINAL